MGLTREIARDPKKADSKVTLYKVAEARSFNDSGKLRYAHVSWPRWIITLFLTHTPIYSEPLFSYFLWRVITSISEAAEDDTIDFFEFYGIHKAGFGFVILSIIFAALALTNLARDLTTANPTEQAHGFATSSDSHDRLIRALANIDELEELKELGAPASEQCKPTWLPAEAIHLVGENAKDGKYELISRVRWAMWLPNAALYICLWLTSIALGSPDALAIVRNDTAPGIKFPVLAFFATLAVIFYHMITSDKIQKSMMVLFGNLLTHPKNTLIAVIHPKNIPFWSEAVIGNQNNAMYRAVATASFSSFMEKVFMTTEQQQGYDKSPGSLVVMIFLFAMAYGLTVGSRLLDSLRVNFKPGVSIEPIHWQNARSEVSKAQIGIIDFLLPFVRSACVSAISALMISNPVGQVAMQVFSVLLLAQGFGVGAHVRWRDKALELKAAEIKETREQAIDPAKVTPKAYNSVEAMFDAYASSLATDGIYSSCCGKDIKIPVTGLAKAQNVGALLIRYIAFIFFVVELRSSRFGKYFPDSFRINTDAGDPDIIGRAIITMFATIVYVEIAKNDFNFFQKEFVENISYWFAKFKLDGFFQGLYSPKVAMDPKLVQDALVARWEQVRRRNERVAGNGQTEARIESANELSPLIEEGRGNGYSGGAPAMGHK